MTDSTLIHFTFGLDAPDLDDEERLRFARQLLPELRQIDEVELEAKSKQELVDLEPVAMNLIAALRGDVGA
jgi:hypothetical protein